MTQHPGHPDVWPCGLIVLASLHFRRILDHPRPHRIQIDIGRHRPRHDHALVALLPRKVPLRWCVRLNHRVKRCNNVFINSERLCIRSLKRPWISSTSPSRPEAARLPMPSPPPPQKPPSSSPTAVSTTPHWKPRPPASAAPPAECGNGSTSRNRTTPGSPKNSPACA